MWIKSKWRSMTKIFVETIPTIFTCCDTLLVAEDVASAARFQNERRRCEHLAWRRIVRRELGRDVHISYNEVGAPKVDKDNIYISVSHCRDAVAVAIADCSIGIDIESLDRDFERVKERYMCDSEMSLCTDKNWAAYAWIAKEAMYKLYGKQGVELREELIIESFDQATLTLHGRLNNSDVARVEISLYDNTAVAVATLEDN